ncbi:MAG: 4-hydroxyphenylacetate 3-hydroxylase [Acidimicrobiia bacterium]|nr:4-hydroxyphenylacetate 3-hydroxylase [Acidimicrobiia bacterium]
MLTGERYRESLRDGRVVILDGRRVDDVTKAPELAGAIDWVADTYDRYVSTPSGAHPMYDIPASVGDLRRRIEVLLDCDMTASLSAAVLALASSRSPLSAADTRYGERIDVFIEECRRNDWRVAEAITDAKGDRMLPPSKQHDPDAYLRVVERRPEGIVVRGCKMHITAAPLVHEIVVLPTKQMKRGEEDYAVAFAVPANTPGLTTVAVTTAPRQRDERDFPVSRHHAVPDGTLLFDDVFVPNERVFLAGEVEHSSTLAHALGTWERTSSIAGSAREADLLVGLAQLVAESNGIERVPHIRDKIAELIIYATMVRAGVEAALNAAYGEGDDLRPDELFTNVTKCFASMHYHSMLRNLQDIAGGLVLTAPSHADLDDEEIGDQLRRYLQASPSMSGTDRLRIFHAVRDLTADALGGWHMVAKIMSGGGMYAQKMVARNHFDMAAARRSAAQAIGLDLPTRP